MKVKSTIDNLDIYPPISKASITVIFLSIAITLLLLRNNHMPFYQSLNFI